MTDRRQKDFFNIKKNRYSSNLVLNPNLHTKKEIAQILKRLYGFSKKDLVADFGAGSGRITLPLLEKGFFVYAIDISQESLDEIKSLSQKKNYKSIEFQQNLPNKKLRAVVGADILHHVDLDIHLPKIINSLDNGGKIVFSEPCALNPSWYIYLPFASSWDVEKGLLTCTYWNLKNKIKNAGFKKVKITGLGLLPRPIFTFSSFLCEINDTLGNLPFFKIFAYRYIIEAEK